MMSVSEFCQMSIEGIISTMAFIADQMQQRMQQKGMIIAQNVVMLKK
ncbi:MULTISPECIES: hypothetical protein [Enterobacteriaceae]|jgi:hypothetical protein|nr:MULTISPECIES: hypothetical protein [Enterobacteriaceae]EKX4083249.1 hypothetical protein [Enterobacter cloacae]MDE5207377.1 hypothetical protein [Citrobacter amalonaticus]HBB6886919.1 hypothetical protein [Citrobacter freundii]ALD78662.1 hypothetical protein P10159_3913 [Citrobacter portucalensis]EKW6205025.1 hypothetical protein [Enterobacter hormaechei]